MNKIDRIEGLRKLAGVESAIKERHLPNLKRIGKHSLLYLAPMLAYAAVDRGVIPLIRSLKEKGTEPLAWKKIVKKDPSFAEDPEIREHFKAIHAMAPKMMDYPSFAIPVLRRAMDYGTRGIPLETAINLSKADPRHDSVLQGSIPFASAFVESGAVHHERKEKPDSSGVVEELLDQHGQVLPRGHSDDAYSKVTRPR